MHAAAFLPCAPLTSSTGRARAGAAVSRRPARVLRSSVRAGLHSAVPDYPAEDGDDDGGDGFFGGSLSDVEKSLGVPIPEMTTADREHLASSRNDAEHLERLMIIAKRRHGEMQMETMRKRMAMGDNYRASSADQYLATLAGNTYTKEASRMVELGLPKPKEPDFVVQGEQAKRPASSPVTPSSSSSASSTSASMSETVDPDAEERAAEVEAEIKVHKLRGMNAGERYVHDLTHGAKNDPTPTYTPAVPARVDVGEAERANAQAVVEDLERQVRELIQRQDDAEENLLPVKTSVSPTETDGADSSMLDKQISFLETHLAKLKAETDVDDVDDLPASPDATARSVRSQVDILSSKLDMSAASAGPVTSQLSEEERIEAFHEMRRRATLTRGAQPADPLAVGIQERDEDLPRSVRDIPASGGSDAEAMRLAVIALRIEHDKYVRDARAALDDFEEAVAAVFKRHAPDLVN
jgi:hypothetical protein